MKSRIGIGTYRMLLGTAQHEAALRHALRNGISVIDTSPNYSNGLAEELIGKVVSHEEVVDRKDVHVISKFGFIQGDDLEFHAKHEWDGAVKFTDDAYYCIDPAFMHHQVAASLRRMATPYVDSYLVHNPEHYLMGLLRPDETDQVKISDAKDQLNEKLSNSFVALEELVRDGQIKSYGISSNSFVLPENHPHFFSPTQFLDMARKAAEQAGHVNHSFTMIETPGNLLERTALVPTAFGGNGVAAWAKGNGVDVVVNRPLSGFDQAGTWRFADRDFPAEYAASRDALLELFSPDIAVTDDMSADEKAEAEELREACGWLKGFISSLDAQIGEFSSIIHFHDDLTRVIIPMINSRIEEMDENTAEALFTFFLHYGNAVRSISGFRARSHVQKSVMEERERLGQEQGVDKWLPPDMADEAFDQFAIKYLLDNENVSSVLVGLTDAKYVDRVSSLL